MKGFFFNLSSFEIIVHDEPVRGYLCNAPGNHLHLLQICLFRLRMLIFFFWGRLRE